MYVRLSIDLFDREYEFEHESELESYDTAKNHERAQVLIDAAVRDAAAVLGTTPLLETETGS